MLVDDMVDVEMGGLRLVEGGSKESSEREMRL